MSVLHIVGINTVTLSLSCNSNHSSSKYKSGMLLSILNKCYMKYSEKQNKIVFQIIPGYSYLEEIYEEWVIGALTLCLLRSVYIAIS